MQYSGGDDSPGYEVRAAVTRSLLLTIETFGIATAAEVGIDTLAASRGCDRGG